MEGSRCEMKEVIECLNSDNISWEALEHILKTYSIRKNPAFSAKIVPTKLPILGWYIPDLRFIAKSVDADKIEEIVDNMPVKFYEESILVALLLGRIKDAHSLLERLDKFVYSIDNWSTCDLLCSELKIIKKNREIFWDKIIEWLDCGSEFVERTAIVLLMKYYLDSDYISKTLALIKQKNSNLYYVNMALGWLLAEACIKSGKEVLEYIDLSQNNTEVYSITASKVRDSYRVAQDIKAQVKVACKNKEEKCINANN